MGIMKSRERVNRIFNHKDVDRPAKDFGGTIVTSITKKAYMKLLDYLNYNYKEDDIEIVDYTMGTVIPSEKILKKLNVDFRRIGLSNKPKIENNKHKDKFGIKLRKAEPHDYYDIFYNPLKELDIEEIEKYSWPKLEDKYIFNNLKIEAEDLYKNSQYGLVGCMGPCNFYEMGQKLRGYEQFGVDLLLNPKIVKKIFDNLLNIQKEYYKYYLDAIGKYIHVIFYADDLGMQDRPQISPKTYRELIKPYHKEIFTFMKNRTDAKLLLHCCGDIYPFLNDLIDVGVDIINPVQVTAKDMDPKRLKDEFGDRIIFWGGIDEQFIVNKGNKEEITENVKEMIKILGKDGGYVVAVAHNIQEDTPPENILLIFDVAEKYSYYDNN